MSKKNRHFPADKKISAETAPLALAPKPSPLHLIFLSLVLILSVVIVYQPSLKVPFLLDDYGKITRNPDIKSLSNIPSRLIYPYTSQFEFHRNDPSRPLTYLTLTLNYHFGQLDPHGYHLVNMALHIAVVLLIFTLALHLLPLVGINGVLPPFLSALLFAVHPINVNAVTYVMGGRPSGLAGVFYLLAVIFFIQAQRSHGWRISASAVCFGFALASNQLAFTLPAIIFLTDFCFFREKNIRSVLQNWKQHIIYWGVLLLYLGLRFAYFGRVGDVEASAQYYGRFEYFLTETVVFWKYIGLILWPSALSFEHLFGPLKTIFDPRVLGALAFGGFLIVIFMKIIRSPWQSGRLILFGSLWFLIILSPTSSFLPTTATIAENRVYLPVIGFCLVLIFIAHKIVGRWMIGRWQSIVLIMIFGFYSVALGRVTYERNVLYQIPANIWADVIQKYPDHQRAHKNLGIEYLNKGQFDLGIKSLNKALDLNPKDFDARNNVAAALYNLGQYQEALKVYQEIIKQAPNHAAAHSNIGMVYEQLKNKEGTIDSYKRALEINPNLIEPLNNLGAIYLELGRFKEAAAMFEAALRIDPNNKIILQNLNRTHYSGSK